MRAIAIALLILAATASGAAAAVPDDLSADPLDRGVLLALPSVYRVETTIRVDRIRLGDGRVLRMPAGGREITEVGTAVAVTPDGWLVTAAHVAEPDAATVARLAYQTREAFQGRAHADEQAAREWVTANGAVAEPGTVARTEVTPAAVGDATVRQEPLPGMDRRRSDTADLALVRIRVQGAPAVTLDDARSTGTPIATIGFSGGDHLTTPAAPEGQATVRRGVIRTSGTLQDGTRRARTGFVVSAGVRSGDSGGPVVDEDGAVRGIIIQRSDSGGGIAETATEVRELLRREGLEPQAGATTESFRAAMAALWRLDLGDAQRRFDATLRAYPRHALASRELARSQALAASPFALRADDRRQGILLGVAVLAVVAAAACAVALARPTIGRPGGGAGGR
ncbi:MAG TPA: serine protease [Miltoncostaeaceae bacterium]|nr:serine protease [Miltoncostaeaceae bacterium]